MSIHRWKSECQAELAELRERSQYRDLRTVEQACQPWVKIENRWLLNLASNNYLGFAGDARLRKAAIKAVQFHGAGATASRLIVGNHPLYEQAESALREWKEAPSALILHSGYTANLGIIAALVGRDDVVFSDRRNHASIVDGIALSRARHYRYRGDDLDHLEKLLKRSNHRRKLIVTDSVFSMDGDRADIRGLAMLKERYGALLMVDEAHSGGVYGERGKGLVAALGMQDRVDIQMGTFSKALGSYGAYVVGEEWLIDYLKNKMRPFIFSTALPPAALGSILAAIEWIQTADERRQRLWRHTREMRAKLRQLGFNIGAGDTQIIPLIIGSNEATVAMSERLRQEGVAAIAIRPPTVPENQARLRLTAMATHRREDLDAALEKAAAVGGELGVIR